MTKEERDEYLREKANKLLSSSKHKIVLGEGGLKEISSESGCYVLYHENKVVYVGESVNLHRYLIRLRNRPHTARTKIARLFMRQDLEEDDVGITTFMEKNMEVAFLEIDLGRVELEEWIIENHNPILNQNKRKKK